MEMCLREVEVGSFYPFGGLKHLIHPMNKIKHLKKYSTFPNSCVNILNHLHVSINGNAIQNNQDWQFVLNKT